MKNQSKLGKIISVDLENDKFSIVSGVDEFTFNVSDIDYLEDRVSEVNDFVLFTLVVPKVYEIILSKRSEAIKCGFV